METAPRRRLLQPELLDARSTCIDRMAVLRGLAQLSYGVIYLQCLRQEVKERADALFRTPR